jgi:hypothetical protein
LTRTWLTVMSLEPGRTARTTVAMAVTPVSMVLASEGRLCWVDGADVFDIAHHSMPMLFRRNVWLLLWMKGGGRAAPMDRIAEGGRGVRDVGDGKEIMRLTHEWGIVCCQRTCWTCSCRI